jgi:cell filamentation protein
MYEAEADPYCYPGTTILINRPGLRDRADLEAFETEMVSQRFREPLPPGRLTARHYCSIHRHLFQDVYAWAGRIRTVQIAKQGSAFCYPEHIEREMQRLFADLTAKKQFRGLTATGFSERATHFLADLNAIHPFREGNGRTQLSFLVALAHRAGHRLDAKRLDPGEMLRAMVRSFAGDEPPLAASIRRLMASC